MKYLVIISVSFVAIIFVINLFNRTVPKESLEHDNTGGGVIDDNKTDTNNQQTS